VTQEIVVHFFDSDFLGLSEFAGFPPLAGDSSGVRAWGRKVEYRLPLMSDGMRVSAAAPRCIRPTSFSVSSILHGAIPLLLVGAQQHHVD